MLISTTMERKLREELAPEHLAIIDESHRHHGHAGAHPQGESHFHIEIVSSAFEGKTPVARQRLVYSVLAEELRERVHALSLATLTPAEAATRKTSRG